MKKAVQTNWLRLLVVTAFVGILVLRQGDDSTSAAPEEGAALPLSRVKALFPNAVAMEPGHEAGVYAVFGQEDTPLGTVLDTTPLSRQTPGYAGPVPCIIALSTEDRVVGVLPLDHNESSSFLDYVAEEGLFTQWDGLTLDQAAEKQVDAITGATLTSDAVTIPVRQTLGHYAQSPPPPEPAHADLPWRPILFGTVAALGVVSFLFRRKLRRFRILLLIANVAVIGFIIGNMLSLALAYGWIRHGVPWRSAVVLVALASAALLLPLITGHNVYCLYICPFGSAQELASKCWRWKRPAVPKPVLRIVTSLRGALVSAAFLTALATASPDFASWEPFAAFNWRSAPWEALALAGGFLVLSIWFPRLWCRTLCPTGYIIGLCRRNKARESARRTTWLDFERGALITACAAALLLARSAPPPQPETNAELESTDRTESFESTAAEQHSETLSRDQQRRRRRGER